MSKEERKIYVIRRAYELARTGQYADVWAIENALIGEGYSEARDLLDRHSVRDDLNSICTQARKAK